MSTDSDMDAAYVDEVVTQENSAAWHIATTKLTLPEVDIDHLTSIITQIDQVVEDVEKHLDVRGSKGLVKALSLSKLHIGLFLDHMDRASISVATINGEKSPARVLGHKKRSVRSAAQHFFETLDWRGLELQCTLFSIDLVGSREEVVAKLVEKQVALVQGDDAVDEDTDCSYSDKEE